MEALFIGLSVATTALILALFKETRMHDRHVRALQDRHRLFCALNARHVQRILELEAANRTMADFIKRSQSNAAGEDADWWKKE